MKETLIRLAVGARLDGPLRLLRRDRLLVLMYHGVVESALEPFCWHQLPLAEFKEQLAWVARRYRVLPLEEALSRWADGTLPPRAAAITFDDGYRNVATHAVPVLRELGLPATVFLVTDLVGTDEVPWPDRLWLAGASSDDVEALKERPAREKTEQLTRLERVPPGPFAMLDVAEVKALAAEGLLSFGPHSQTHEILAQCEDAEIVEQIEGSYRQVSAWIGRAPRVFAYPNGRRRDFDERAKRAVRAAGMPWALTTEEGLVARGDDPLALRRVCVGADLSFARFRLLCAGL